MIAKDPEQIIADWRGDAQRLRARGHVNDAALLEQCADEMQEGLGLFLLWLSEPDARLKSGRSVEYFRVRFAEWQAQGMAELRGKRRFYRSIIVPQRAHASAARLAGFQGVRPA